MACLLCHVCLLLSPLYGNGSQICTQPFPLPLPLTSCQRHLRREMSVFSAHTTLKSMTQPWCLSLASPNIFNCLLDVSSEVFHQYYTLSLKTNSTFRFALLSTAIRSINTSCFPLLLLCLFLVLTQAPVSQQDPAHGLLRGPWHPPHPLHIRRSAFSAYHCCATSPQ